MLEIDGAEVLELKEEFNCSVFTAKEVLVKRKLVGLAKEAKTVEELRLVVVELIEYHL